MNREKFLTAVTAGARAVTGHQYDSKPVVVARNVGRRVLKVTPQENDRLYNKFQR